VASLCKGSFISAFVGESDRPMWSACSAASEHWMWGGYIMYACLLKTRQSQTSTAGLSHRHTGMHLPGVSVTNWSTMQRAGRRGAFDVHSCYTCSLCGGTWNAGLICSHILSSRTMCFSRRGRLLLIVIAAGVSVSTETRKLIYRIRRYCKATSEYSPIHSIGLTLLKIILIVKIF